MGITRAVVNFGTGRIAFGGIGASYSSLLSATPGKGTILFVSNSLNQEIVLSLDGGTTDFITLQPGHSPVIDFGSNECEFSGAVSVKHAGVAPTSGAISAGVLRRQ